MNLKQALEVADLLEQEGVVSTVGMALRTLAKQYRELKSERDLLEHELNKKIPIILRTK